MRLSLLLSAVTSGVSWFTSMVRLVEVCAVPGCVWGFHTFVARYSILTPRGLTVLGLLFYSQPRPVVGLVTLTNTVVNVTLARTPTLPSLERVFGSLAWAERESTEMVGIKFSRKADTRPLYLWGGFSGLPLSKKFPTPGFFELSLGPSSELVWSVASVH